MVLRGLFPHLQLLENNRDLVHHIPEHPTTKYHHKYGKYPSRIRFRCDVAVTDGDHGHDGPVVADYVLSLPVADFVAHLVFVRGQPNYL